MRPGRDNAAKFRPAEISDRRRGSEASTWPGGLAAAAAGPWRRRDFYLSNLRLRKGYHMEKIEGQIFKLPSGRWLFAPVGWHEITSGDVIELMGRRDYEATRIEHSHAEGGYYAINGAPLENGNWARITKNL